MGLGADIKLTGTSFQYHLEGDYPVCRDKKKERGGQMRKRSRKIIRSEVTDKGLDSIPVASCITVLELTHRKTSHKYRFTRTHFIFKTYIVLLESAHFKLPRCAK